MEPDIPFKEVVRILRREKVSAVPVVAPDDGEVVGVVSEADLLPKEEFRDGGRSSRTSSPASLPRCG